MCGLVAILSLDDTPVAAADLERMCAAQVHRGPDSAGYALLDGGCAGLASVRLSIMDLAGGDQPLFNEDYSIGAVCNGEIYDYCDERRELERRGHLLRTRSDSELIVHWYEELGADFVSRLNGEFAFVLWDERAQRLIAARDRAGVKPLYYVQQPRRLLISSEVRGLFAAGVPRRLSQQYLTGAALGAMDGHSAAFSGVQCLGPGRRLVADRRLNVQEESYHSWSFDVAERMTLQDAAEQVRAAVTKAVERRLVADVPVQCYLSGGLDSAIVCGLMAQAGKQFCAYHVAFPDSPYDESQRAAAVARHFGQTLETIACGARQLAENLVATVRHVEAPLSNCNAVGKFLLSQFVRASGDKVCLTGEGADEAFGGYAYFKLEALWRSLAAGEIGADDGRRLWRQFQQAEWRSLGLLWHPTQAWKRAVLKYGYPSYLQIRAAENGAIVPWLFAENVPRDAVERRFLEAFSPTAFEKLHPFNATRKMAFAVLADGIIPQLGDRVEMAHSVECRTPFLDADLLGLATRIPPAHFLDLRSLREKHVLQSAFAGLLPPEMQIARKHPFLAPTWRSVLATAHGREILNEYLSPHSIRRAGFFRPWFVAGLRSIWQRLPPHWSVARRLEPLIGILLSTQILHREVVESTPSHDAHLPMMDRTPSALSAAR
jgi:asparagine synthase (glutamine-hydrolysing)